MLLPTMTYKEMYDGMVDAVEKAVNSEELAKSLESVRGVTPETIRRAVQNPISGLTLNETLEKNRQTWTIVNKKDTKRERLRRNHLLKSQFFFVGSQVSI